MKQSAKQDKERAGRGRWELRKGKIQRNCWTCGCGHRTDEERAHMKPDSMNLQSAKCEWSCLLLVSLLFWEQAGKCHDEDSSALWSLLVKWFVQDHLQSDLQSSHIVSSLSTWRFHYRHRLHSMVPMSFTMAGDSLCKLLKSTFLFPTWPFIGMISVWR